jgi:hypothetical protein
MLSTITHACTAPVNGAAPVAEDATTLGTLVPTNHQRTSNAVKGPAAASSQFKAS